MTTSRDKRWVPVRNGQVSPEAVPRHFTVGIGCAGRVGDALVVLKATSAQGNSG